MYERLLLATGGGITAAVQKSDHINDSANIIVALGGTATCALKMLKTQAYARFKRTESDVNGYKRIKFLSIDTDTKKVGKQDDIKNNLDLTDDEVANIDADTLLNHLPNIAEWLDWFNRDGVDNAVGGGAGGIRAKGRLGLMGHMRAVASKLTELKNSASEGFDGVNKVYFHVISGLSGGTGSGIFLDVCYLIQHLFPEANIIGYFFLPELNLGVVNDDNTKIYIRGNGYGAMQDLDYCMEFPDNGDSVGQHYDLAVEPVSHWGVKPVRLCHIIGSQGAVNMNGRKSYYYAMNVVVEYILDFLTQSDQATHSLQSEIDNADARIAAEKSNRKSGYNCGYSAMGSSSLIVPFREINTYLVAKLFGKFGELNAADLPTGRDCLDLACKAFTPGGRGSTQDDIYAAVWADINSNAPFAYNDYPNDVKDIDWSSTETDPQRLANYDANISIPGGLFDCFDPQFADKIGRLETNRSSMVTMTNERSLASLISAKLLDCAKDVNKGPRFAFNAIGGARENNLINIVTGLINANNTRRGSAHSTLLLRIDEYNKSVEKAKAANALNKKKRSRDAVDNLIAYYEQKQTCIAYDKLNDVLTTFKSQLEGDVSLYFGKIDTVYTGLRSVFATDMAAIDANTSLIPESSYDEYLVKLSDIRQYLDNDFETVIPNIPNAFDSFVTFLTRDRDTLFDDNDNRFCENVIKFFADGDQALLRTFLTYTVDTYIRMAVAKQNTITDYTTITDQQIETYVSGYLRDAYSKARPFIEMDNRIQGTLNPATDLTGWITIPAQSNAISNAVAANHETLKKINVSKTNVTDRIFIETRFDAVALSAAGNISGLESSFSQSKDRHIYTGKPHIDGKFNDWSRLAPLTPVQFLDKNAPIAGGTMNYVFEYQDVFNRAVEAGLFGVTNDHKLSVSDIDHDRLSVLNAQCDSLEQDIDADGDDTNRLIGHQGDFTNRLADLRTGLNGLIVPRDNKDIKHSTVVDQKNDPQGIEHDKKFFCDMFVKAPQMVMNTKRQLDEYSDIRNRIETVGSEINERIQFARNYDEKMNAFCDALFSGTFKLDAFEISFNHTVHDDEPHTEFLSANNGKFTYFKIPPYQAFITFSDWYDNNQPLEEAIARKRQEQTTALLGTRRLDQAVTDNVVRRIDSWRTAAEIYPDKQGEIVSFLDQLDTKYRTFKQVYGV